MVTGDNAVTAKNIAQKCGIYHPDQGGLVMEGPEFRKLKDKEHELNAAIFKLDVCLLGQAACVLVQCSV
jgi:Ca2+-transporting ATPase